MDFHISRSGDDRNPGTREKPWRTLGRVRRATLTPGDRLLLRGGETFVGSLTLGRDKASGDPNAPVTIGTYGSGRATIRSGRETAVLVRNWAGIIVQNLIVSGSGPLDNTGRGVRLVNDMPGNLRIAVARVEDVLAGGFGQEGIFVGGDGRDKGQSGYQGIRITRCEAFENRMIGIHVIGYWDPAATTYANADVVISRCIARDNPGDPNKKDNHSGNGIIIAETDGGRIERCTAYRNGAKNGSQAGGPVGIWTHASNNITIEYCESYENRTGGGADGGGFDLDGGVTNSIIQYCYSRDNDGAGFLVWNYYGAPHRLANNIIRYCISENDGRNHNYYGGIHVGRGNAAGTITNLALYHNTLLVEPQKGGVSPEALVIDGAADVKVINNLLATRGIPLVKLDKNQRVAFRGNAYWSGGEKFAIRDGDRNFDSLDAWRTATGQEKQGQAETGLIADPGLGRAGRLAPDSPLRGKTLDLRPFGLDIGLPDIGAPEWSKR